MKSHLGVEDLNNKDFALEGLKLFGFTKQNLDLLPSVNYDFHQPNKVNYSFPRPNSWTKIIYLGIFKLYIAWYGSYDASVGDSLPYFIVAHYKITSHLMPMLDDASQYMHSVQW